MQIDLPYRKHEEITISIPDRHLAGIVEPRDVHPEGSAGELVEHALQHATGETGFAEFLQGSGELLVIVNDGTRPTPTRIVLDVIGDALYEAGARYIIATGVHRGPTEEEYRFIFGDAYDRIKDRILVHEARDAASMVHIGVSKQGTVMEINRHAYEASRILVIGSVEPHYFAGYTGGRKGILPGVASYRTIEQNHKHALHPGAKALALKGNPVHEDMVDALATLGDRTIFAVMTVLDKHHGIYAVTAGDIISSFDTAVERANEVFTAEIPAKADIVISCARYPMDIDLYQSQKAIDNGKLALKEGGTLILVSSCWDGVGEEAFVEMLGACETPEAVLERISGTYRLGYHKAGKMAEVFTWAKVLAKTDLPDTTLERIFIKPVQDLQEAIDEALRHYGNHATVLVLPDGSVTVPLLHEQV